MRNKKTLRVLSLGAGVQSSTLALMIEKGEIPMVDCAIFADTQGEPKKVYDHLDWLEKQLSYPVYRVTKGNLKEDTLNAIKNNVNVAMSPFFTRNKTTGKQGIMMRQCTNNYKIIPLIKEIRRLLGVGYRKQVPKNTIVTQIFGISYDEITRMRTAPKKYMIYEYPLVELKIRRHQCLDWMKKNGYPEPPRSACTFCPYHSNKEWKIIKENKEEWNDVIAFDEKIRNGFEKVNDELYLHKSAEPIKDANLEDKDANQLSLLDECDGMCGV
jgi:hypothetical protein